jgi:branched-chain amino acid transport system permease protein
MDILPFIVAGLGVGVVYALSGVGLVVLYRASGVLNFAFGAIGAAGAYAAWSTLEASGSLLLALVAALLTSTLISLAYGKWVAPRLAESDVTIRSIGSIGFALVVMGLINFAWGDKVRRLPFPTDFSGIDLFEVRVTATRLIGLALAAAMVAGISWLLARTRLGLWMRGVASDRRLSALLGVQVLRVDLAAWGLSGAFAGVCGLLLANIVRLEASFLTFLVIPAFAAAIVGRLKSLPMTLVGGMGIGLVEAVATTWGGFASFRSATPFLVALGVLLMSRPTERKV